MSTPPYLPLFGDDYLRDTMHLTLAEHGAYLKLLMIAWRSADCALPDDDQRLARMLAISGHQWAKIKPTVMAFWRLDGNKWHNNRLTVEREYATVKSRKQSERATKGWDTKRLKSIGWDDATASDDDMPGGCPEDAAETPPNPNPNPSKKEPPKPPEGGRARKRAAPPLSAEVMAKGADLFGRGLWDDFVAYRQTHKQGRMTDRAAAALIDQIAGWTDLDPAQVLVWVMVRGWAAPFKPRDFDLEAFPQLRRTLAAAPGSADEFEPVQGESAAATAVRRQLWQGLQPGTYRAWFLHIRLRCSSEGGLLVIGSSELVTEHVRNNHGTLVDAAGKAALPGWTGTTYRTRNTGKEEA